MNKKTTSQRLREFIDAEGINVTNLEDQIGYSNDALGKYLRDNKELNPKITKLIIKALPNLNEDWLKTGLGDMYNTTAEIEDNIVNSYHIGKTAEDQIKTLMSMVLDLQHGLKKSNSKIYQLEKEVEKINKTFKEKTS